MENVYSKHWMKWSAHHIVGIQFYAALFFYTFNKAKNKSNTTFIPSEALHHSTNIISTINATLCVLSFIITLFRKEFTKNIICEPNQSGFYGHAWMSAYFFSDALCHYLIARRYGKKYLRMDIIWHHVFGYLVFALVAIPRPIYGWYGLHIELFGELSTIFLNLIYFAKHYHWNKNIFQFLFIISWFSVRLPCCVAVMLWVFNTERFKRIKNEYPMHVAIAACLLPCMHMMLQLWFTFKICSKYLRSRSKLT
eukprot:524373_1